MIPQTIDQIKQLIFSIVCSKETHLWIPSKLSTPFQEYAKQNPAMKLLDNLHNRLLTEELLHDQFIHNCNSYCTWISSESFDAGTFEFSWTLGNLEEKTITDAHFSFGVYTHQNNENVEILIALSSILCLQLYDLSNLKHSNNTLRKIIHHRKLMQYDSDNGNCLPKWMPFVVYADIEILHLLQDMIHVFAHFSEFHQTKHDDVLYLAHGSMLTTSVCTSALNASFADDSQILNQCILSLLKGSSFVLKLAWYVSLEHAIIKELIHNSQAVRAQIHIKAFIDNLHTTTLPQVTEFFSKCTSVPSSSGLVHTSLQIGSNLQTLQSLLQDDLLKLGLSSATCKCFKDIAIQNSIDLHDIDPFSAAITCTSFDSIGKRIHMISDQDVIDEVVNLWRYKLFYWIWKPC